MDDHGEVSDLGSERVIFGGQQGDGNDDERIVFANEEAAGFQVRHAALEIGDALAQPFFALGRGCALGEFLFRILDPAFPTGHHRIGHRGFFRPPITGERLIVRRGDDGLRHRREAVAVGTVRNHIHVRLQIEHPPAVVGAQIEHGFAVEEVMFCQDLIQQRGLRADARRLGIIQLAVPGGHLGVGEQRGQARQQLGKFGIG